MARELLGYPGSFGFVGDMSKLGATLTRLTEASLLRRVISETGLVTGRRMARVVHAERALWLEQDGEEVRAVSERAAAQSDFDYLVAHLGDSTLEEAFLESERVKGLKMR